MCTAPGHREPDDVWLAGRLAMARQLQPLPWGACRGEAGLQSRLVDGIQYCRVPLVLQERARQLEDELGLVEYIYVSEPALVGGLLV